MTSLRRLRTQRALAVAGLVAVAAPLLSSCGFDYATDRPNTIANGGYHITGDVHVAAARIVAPSQGTGTFVATIAVDPEAKPTKLTGLSGKGLTVGQMTPVEVASNGSVNLFTQGGIPVTGDFGAGDSVPVSLTFDNGESIDVNAVVVKQCHEYADVQTATPRKPRGSQQASGGASGSASAQPSGEASATAESTDEASITAESTSEAYSCDYATAGPQGEGH